MQTSPTTIKRILITGGAGFIGSHVVRLLARDHPDYTLVVLDKLDYCASTKSVHPEAIFVKGDIQCADLVSHVLQTFNIDHIMHFAAQTHVDNSFGNSFSFTQNNVLGTHVLLECAKQWGKISLFIHVSTDEVYGEVRDHEVKRTPASLLSPTNPYAATKAAAENLVLAYHRSFGLPIIITRGNNVYGPGQFPEKLIPKCILLLERDKPLMIHGDGSHKRSFLFVQDVARAFDTILHRGTVGSIYNIGTDNEVSTLAVAHKLCEIAGKDPRKYVVHVADRPFNDCRYSIDSSALETLGWQPEVGWHDGVMATVEWYKENAVGYWDDDEVSNTIVQAHPRRKV